MFASEAVGAVTDPAHSRLGKLKSLAAAIISQQKPMGQRRRLSCR